MDKFYADRRLHALLVLSLAISLLSGCVERRYTIRTDPPGATVVVNGEEIGPSPASKSFVYYGDRKITLVHDGYETKTLIQPINAPWWDNYLTEFFTENIIPVSMRDEREYQYKLEPAQSPPQGELRDRAEGLRTDARVLPKPRRGGFLGWLGFD
jgi:PEGA domain